MLLGLCDPASALCPKESNILVYFLIFGSLLILLFGMTLLLRAGKTNTGNADYSEAPLWNEKAADMHMPSYNQTERSISEPFDREAILAEMKTPPIFGNAQRRPLQSATVSNADERVITSLPFEPAAQDVTNAPAPALTPDLEPASTPSLSPTLIKQPKVQPAISPPPFSGHFGAHMPTSPMAPRLAAKGQVKE